MSMAYIKKHYGMSFTRGDRVKTMEGDHGHITSATHYIRVRIDGEYRSRNYHPTDVEVIETRPLRFCMHCKTPLVRRIMGDGSLEGWAKVALRTFCGRGCADSHKRGVRLQDREKALPESDVVPFPHVARILWKPGRLVKVMHR